MDINVLHGLYLAHPKVITDTRKIEADCLFFALKGPRFDGNTFAEEALKKGAAFAVVDDSGLKGDRFIVVENVLQTLQTLAHYHRKQLHIPILAVTGSNGKTTTKELLFAVLNSQYQAYATKGNLNNHIGVPLTLLAMPEGTQVAVIEMGANHQGEIALLSEIVAPTHGLITNIGKAHLEGFGGPEGVKKGKGELYRYLEKHNGTVFVNLDEAHLKEMAGTRLRIIPYCKSEELSMDHPESEVQLVATDPFITVQFLDENGSFCKCESQLSGSYNFNNMMTAIAIGKYFKVPGKKISQAIAAYLPANNRSQILRRGSNTFYLDAYNANPSSMAASLNHFSGLPDAQKIVILGDMFELGEYSREEHKKMIDLARNGLYRSIILVGSEFEKVAPVDERILCFENVEDVKNWLKQRHFKNTSFLLKGSRAIELETILS